MTPFDVTRRVLMLLATCCAALALLLVLAAAADACPMCKVALANHDEAQGDVIGGFFWSILFMLSMPFAILGTFSGYMYLLVRRARAQQAAGQTTVAGTRPTAAPARPLRQASSLVPHAEHGSGTVS